MRGVVLPLIGAVFLSGCGGEVFSVCPRIEPYSREVQSKAADELDALPADSALSSMIADYGVMRAELRGGGC